LKEAQELAKIIKMIKTHSALRFETIEESTSESQFQQHQQQQFQVKKRLDSETISVK